MSEIEFRNYNNEEDKDNIIREVGSFIWEIVKVFVLALVIIVPIKMFLFQPFRVEGASMYPNFYDKDYLIVNELGYKEDFYFFKMDSFREIQRGDIVVFRPGETRKPYYIKRVIGLPGESVYVGNDQIIIYNDENPDGFILEETDYLSKDIETCAGYSGYSCEEKTVELAKDEYFFMGDNRRHSRDSRDLGAFTADKIIGKVVVRLWPVTRLKIF